MEELVVNLIYPVALRPELKSSGGDAEAAIELRSVNKKNA